MNTMIERDRQKASDAFKEILKRDIPITVSTGEMAAMGIGVGPDTLARGDDIIFEKVGKPADQILVGIDVLPKHIRMFVGGMKNAGMYWRGWPVVIDDTIDASECRFTLEGRHLVSVYLP